MVNAYKPLNEYPYRYAPPIAVYEKRSPARGYPPIVQGLIPNAAAVRYNVGGFDPGVAVSNYARPKDLHALSIQPFDLAVPGIEPLPVDATLPTLRREILDDEDDLDEEMDDDLIYGRPARGSRMVYRDPGPYARRGARAHIVYAAQPMDVSAAPVASFVAPQPDAGVRPSEQERTQMMRLALVGLAGLVGGIVIGSALARR
jgi:hypothetical protein